MAKTYLDVLVEYPAKALQKIGADSTIISLLADKPSPTDDDADEAYEKYLFDYNYVDDSTTEARAYICTEVELNNSQSPTMQDLRFYVMIYCHKEYMALDQGKFTGIMGNRRDNLVRSVDLVLNHTDIFGIGLLALRTVRTVRSPDNFTCRELCYEVSDFKYKKMS